MNFTIATMARRTSEDVARPAPSNASSSKSKHRLVEETETKFCASQNDFPSAYNVPTFVPLNRASSHSLYVSLQKEEHI